MHVIVMEMQLKIVVVDVCALKLNARALCYHVIFKISVQSNDRLVVYDDRRCHEFRLFNWRIPYELFERACHGRVC